MSADLTTRELGEVGSEEAVSLFNSHSWPQEITHMLSLEAKSGVSSSLPDLTFSALPSHLIVSTGDSLFFNVEVCIPAARRLFGIFPHSKFYTYKGLKPEIISKVISEFFGDNLEIKHNFFAGFKPA